MRNELVLLTNYDPHYLRIVEYIVASIVDSGAKAFVLDTTATSGVPVDTYHPGLLKLAGYKLPQHRLEKVLAGYDATLLNIDNYLSETEELSPEQDEELQIAVQSALITYFRTDAPNRAKSRVSKIARGIERDGKLTLGAVKRIIAEYSISKVYLPNGRFPGQAMATVAAREAGIPTVHYEKGETANGAYIQPYSPQDRFDSQEAVKTVLKGLSDQEVAATAGKWLAMRSPSDESRNEFSAQWPTELPEQINTALAGKKVIGFFTSSQDEFQFLGPEWQRHSWESQYEAYDLVLNTLKDEDFVAYLRVHPNLATKAHECFLREKAGIEWLQERHPNLYVIWHDQPVNTYLLLDKSERVFVWDSTVGLEANVRGIPVWTAATARYGLVTDTREFLSPADVTTTTLTPWKVDPTGAQRFIATLMLRDQQIPDSFERWETWETANTPFLVKIAALLRSGGNPTTRDALQASFDVYRHRNAQFNSTHIKNKI